MATYTFNPDANPETSSVDGYVADTTVGTWSANRARTTGSSAIPSNVVMRSTIEARFSTNEYQTQNITYLVFDITSLPIGSGDVDESNMTVSVRVNAITMNGNFASDSHILVACGALASDTALATADLDVWKGGSQASDDEVVSSTPTSAFFDFTLNAAGVQHVKDAIDGSKKVRFAILSKAWFENNEPTWVSNQKSEVEWASADSANDPELSISEDLAPSTVSPTIFGITDLSFRRPSVLAQIYNMDEPFEVAVGILTPSAVGLPAASTPMYVYAQDNRRHRSDNSTLLRFVLGTKAGAVPLGSASSVTITIFDDEETKIVDGGTCTILRAADGEVGYALDGSLVSGDVDRLWAEFKIDWGMGAINVAPTRGRVLITLHGT